MTMGDNHAEHDISYLAQLAHCRIGARRLDFLQVCVEDVIQNKVPGDLICMGIWRGGVGVFLRALLHAFNVIHDP